MASVMAIRRKVFGSCVGEINASVEAGNRGAWLCCGLFYLRLMLAGKLPQDWQRRREMVPAIGGHLGQCEHD
jgi:hypothetical protein